MNPLTPHQQAAMNLDSHISLTANAGSGKTLVLSRRYIEIVLKEKIALRNIAAITFTEKAASELYRKIAAQIEERLQNTRDENTIRILENMRRQLVSANISTIHSFCIDILREYPVEAGLDANFSPIDEQLSTELIELTVEDTIKASIQNKLEEPRLKKLIRFFSSKSTLARELISLIQNRKNVLNIADKIYGGDEKDTADFFKRKFKELIPLVVLKEEFKVLNFLSEINNAVLKNKPDNSVALEAAPVIEKIKNTGDYDGKIFLYGDLKKMLSVQKGTLKVRDYLGKQKDEMGSEIKTVEKFFTGLEGLEFSANSAEIELELANYGHLMLHFFMNALKSYEAKKNENGYLDYEDILLCTKEILNKENVRNGLSEKYKYIMIDEYQDTNEIQYNIFLPILDMLKKGNLFVVGDEKQSIYMFRDAELEVFAKTKKDIADKSGEQFLLTLPDSFRMAPSIALFANLLFKRLFADPDPLYNEVNHNDIVCARKDELRGKIEILIPQPEHGGQVLDGEDNGPGNIEAEFIAARILKLLKDETSESISWNEIAVLCRKRKSFAELEKAFVKFKIPFTILGGKGFYQRQSIYDIYNYFSFLSDNGNDTALIGTLRSPFFNLSDSEIFEISLLSGSDFREKLKVYAGRGPAYNNIVRVLEENTALSDSYDITALLRKILNESDFLAALSSKPNGVQETANINKLIRLTINFASQGFKTLYDYVNFLKDSIERTEDEAQAVLPEESDSVKIMTIHQAKGLEFKAVFLYKCDDKSDAATVKSKSFTVDKSLGLLTKVPVGENYFSDYQAAPIVGIANIISRKKNIAENKRLFYVAVTRAMNYLFISAGPKKEFEYNENSFIGLLAEALNLDLSAAEFKTAGSLQFLTEENGFYVNTVKMTELRIPVLKKIENGVFEIKIRDAEFPIKLAVEKIGDVTESEIISATKVAIFMQCPVKYQLTYEYGYANLFGEYRNWILNNRLSFKIENEYEFNPAENAPSEENYEPKPLREMKRYGDVKGRIIHELLDKGPDTKDLKKETGMLIRKELARFDEDSRLAEQLKEDIIADILNFYESEEYNNIKGFTDYKNEYEIYAKEGDFFLYGIIDKIIFDADKIIIIDYKTDDIAVEEIGKKSKAYLTQLNFYAYIVSKLYPGIGDIETRLIFIKHPHKTTVRQITKKMLQTIKGDIIGMVKLTRTKNYLPVTEHCRDCNFAVEGKCIKKSR